MIFFLEWKHYKMLCHSIYAAIYAIFLMVSSISFSSCNRDIDLKIAECYHANDTIIHLYDLYPEEWDSVYFFGNCSLAEISSRLGISVYNLGLDFGERIFLLNKYKEIVYYKEWLPNYGQAVKGALFCFNNDSSMIAIPRKKTKFLIRKRDAKSFWVFYQDESNEQIHGSISNK